MTKILIADDSPTIHKVVQLTLASSGHELDIASNSEQLMQKIESSDYGLVLLDFTLSDSSDGYQLASKINELKKTKILAMLGTFDSIDDNKMVESGILDKIQKPFESQKFINLCNHLIETDLESFQALDSLISDDDSLNDDWIVTGQDNSNDFNSDSLSLEDDSVENNNDQAAFSVDDLSDELSSWGVKVPGVIGKSQRAGPLFPPVIEKTATEKQDLASLIDDQEISDEGNSFDLSVEKSTKELSFVSADVLQDEEDDWSTDSTSSQHQNSPSLLESELEEVNSDDFWAIDDGSSRDSIVESKEEIEEVRFDLAPTDDLEENTFSLNIEEAPMKDEDLEFPEPKKRSAQPAPGASAVNIDEIVDRVVAKMTEQIEELVKKSIEKKIEEISWEIIPDLAENLIKKEIRRISDSVIDSH